MTINLRTAIRVRISARLPIEESFTRILKEETRGRTLIPDVLSLSDLTNAKAAIISKIANDLDGLSYRAQPLLKMDVPDDSFWIRPGAIPLFMDRVTYDALSHFIGRKVDSSLNSGVFSYRFDNHGELLPGVDQWKKFEDAFWNSLNSNPDTVYVLTSDITSYYTNINLDVLRNHILTLIGNPTRIDQSIVDTLFDVLLQPWATSPISSGLGIPQGVDASSILGNLLLHHIDDSIARIPGVSFSRYMDDMRLVASDKVTAKKALSTLIKSLRDIGLDINKSKTRVLSKEAATKELLDPLSVDIDNANKLVRTKRSTNVKKAMPILMKIFQRCLDRDNPFYQRHLSFFINRLILLRKYLSRSLITKTTNLFTSKFESLPGCSKEISRFCRYFPCQLSKNRIISFLRSKDNIYEWQELWLLDCLLRCNIRTIKTADLNHFDEIAQDRRRHLLCRAKAILLIGKFGDQHRRHDLMVSYAGENDTIIKRAIVVACQQLSSAERNNFYSNIKTDPEVSYSVQYVESLRRPKYCEEEDWKPFDIPDWGTY